LDPHQFVALRADDKQYHDDTLWNILTYMYGCRFGIAVFERIEVDAFNPNVSLEVGYMMGLGKPVCYLEERTLPALHTDLVGRLYQTFDLQSCEETIPRALWKWMTDKGLMVQRVERNTDETTM
jgi:nucleoside 2-deoxyribosyltransferase